MPAARDHFDIHAQRSNIVTMPQRSDVDRADASTFRTHAMPDPHAEILRRLTPAQKLAVAQQLRETAWMLSAAGVRARHPELCEAEVQARVRDIFLHAVT